MRALTIWQPWATLIAEGLKPYEFRGWAAPAYVQGQRIAIHAGARPIKSGEVKELLLMLQKEGSFGTGLVVHGSIALLERVLAGMTLPRSAIVCTGVLGTPIRAGDIPGLEADSDRIDHSKWGWPITEIQRLEPPAPATGMQGFWTWRAEA
ncbi:MAG: hypothetical protein JWR10_3405 [Rubritepida sp.]|nr:hypothetical protein [Rubritepida sp.]